jgi:hypothetical protein
MVSGFSILQLFTDDPEKATFLPSNRGTLVVFTATEEEYSDGIYRIYYDSYKIFDESGKLIKKIHGSFESPVTVSLEEGVYLIDAKLRNGKSQKVTAKIEAGKTTEVK